MSHLHPIPAVRAIIIDKEDQVLLLKRGDEMIEAGNWCLPGGKVDFGLTVTDALRNEVKEETNLDCIKIEFLFYRDKVISKYKNMHFITFYMKCDVIGQVKLNHESSDYAWVKMDDLKNYNIAFENDLAVLKYWECKN
jgi:8-oxo-dGTP diphosphatase